MIKANKITKGMLIDMDERFLEWLSNADGSEDIKEAIKSRFITIHGTPDMEVDIAGHNNLEEVKKNCTESLEEKGETGWDLLGIFDLELMKEVRFKEIIRVEIEGIDF